jgi:hypothetical protein
MGTEFLVACLWVVVFVYWFWSRLPARADTVGVYRRALHVLEHAAPTRVVPAYRLRAPAISSAAAPLAAVALCHKRAQLRRRRRDTLSVLLGAVLVTMAAALVTRSAVAFVAQVLCDIALGSYVSLLVRAARASVGAAPARRNAMAAQPLALAARLQAAYPDWPGAKEPVRLPAQPREVAPQVASYVPAHALKEVDLRVVANDVDDYPGRSYAGASYAGASYAGASDADDSYGDESYGDFDSYASLALATAR